MLRLCLLGSLCFLAACSEKAEKPAAGPARAAPQKQAVEVTPIVRRDVAETVTVVGSIAANESAVVRPEAAGLIREIFFDEGQPVKKGDVLLKIDDSELRAQLAQTEARFKLAELNVARSENLSESRTIPQSEVDRSRTDFATSKAELSLLKLRIAKTELKAPFDGVAGSRAVSPGDYVTTQSAITTINDLSRLKIEFQVPERFLGKVKTGTGFSLQSRGLDASKNVRGEVYFVSSVIDRATRSSEVKGLLTNPPAELRPGMFANVEIVLDTRKGALTVPEGSILVARGGTQIIAVKEDGENRTAEFIPVTLGLRSRGFVEITPVKGTLAENQQIVASGVGGLILFPGAPLDPRPLRKEFQIGN